jgi:hypothetical protein
MNLQELTHLKPEQREQEAVTTITAQAGLLHQWADMLLKPGLSIDELEALALEVKLSSAWLTVALNQRKAAKEEREKLQPYLDFFERRAGQ